MYKSLHAVMLTAVVLCARESLANSDSPPTDRLAVSVLTLGTSLTANYQWPRELGERLAQCFGVEAKVENKARAGATSSDGQQQFNSRNTLNPDIVLVEFVANDADLLDGVNLEVSRRNHAALVALIRQKSPNSKIVLMIMSPAFGLRGLMRPTLTRYHTMYRQLAASSDVALIDLGPWWKDLLAKAGDNELLPDGLHPTQSAASQVVFPALRNKIGELLRATRPNICVHTR